MPRQATRIPEHDLAKKRRRPLKINGLAPRFFRYGTAVSITYRSSVFACFYLGVLALVAAVWFFLPEMPIWGAIFLVIFGALGFPLVWAKVEIDEEGIRQQLFRHRFIIRWVEVISWKRIGHPGSDGPDTITLETRTGSFTLNHNCG